MHVDRAVLRDAGGNTDRPSGALTPHLNRDGIYVDDAEEALVIASARVHRLRARMLSINQLKWGSTYS